MPFPDGVAAVAIVTVFAKVALSVSPAAPALNLHGLAVPVQLPPVQPAKRVAPDAAAGVIVIASPSSARQVVTPPQLAIPASPIVAVPEPVPAVAVAIVTSLA